MPTANDVLANSLSASQAMLNRLCSDLTPAEYLHRPCAVANCAAWIVGHLVMTERMSLTRVGVTDQPALPEGFEKRFSRDPDAPKAADFGDVSILLPLFNLHRDRLIEAVKALPPEVIDRPLETPHPFFSKTGEAINFMGIHTSMHAGQISMIRRTLGRTPLI